MSEPDLEALERTVLLRPLEITDFEALVAMQQRCFPGLKPWQRDQIESQLAIFPAGQLVIEVEGRLAASASSLVVSFDHYEQWHDWHAIADGGHIRNHDPAGDTLYGIEIMVDPAYRGLRFARRLYEARKALARRLNLERVIIGGRIPGYGHHAVALSAWEYVDKVVTKELVDPVLTPQLSNGFAVQGLIPDYFPSDVASRGYATFLAWTNPDFRPSDLPRSHRTVQVRLCLVQYRMRRVASWDDFAQQVAFFVDLGSDYRSDFVVFPELFSTQLLSFLPPERPGLGARRLAEHTTKVVAMFRDLAVKHNVNIVGGSHFVLEDETLYNVAYLFRRNGTIAEQRKLHITPNERKWWGVAGGDRLEVFDTDRGRVAILICYDVEFPELARLAAARGANILFVPFNTDERYGYLRVRHCAQARAIENQVYVATAGCAGLMPGVENADIHYAQSGIFTPSDFPFARDAVASESTPNVETIVVHDVDLELLRRNRVAGTVRPWTDRRTDLYGVRYTDLTGEDCVV